MVPQQVGRLGGHVEGAAPIRSPGARSLTPARAVGEHQRHRLRGAHPRPGRGGRRLCRTLLRPDTVDVCDFDGTVRGGYTAHPIEEPGTGELHAVSYHFGRGDTVLTPSSDRRPSPRKLPIRVGGSPMMHAFSLTPDFVVIYDLPVTFDVRSAVTANVARPLRPFAALALSATIGRVRLPRPVLNRVPATRAGSFPYRWDHRYPPRVGSSPAAVIRHRCGWTRAVLRLSSGQRHQRGRKGGRGSQSCTSGCRRRPHRSVRGAPATRALASGAAGQQPRPPHRLGDENVEFPRFDDAPHRLAPSRLLARGRLGRPLRRAPPRPVRSPHGIQAMRDFGPDRRWASSCSTRRLRTPRRGTAW